jgi:Excalibur calcium-binding domain
VLCVVIGLGLLVSLASAHQSGCHRWHSCPSDTGSYVCGDLGYDSQCSTSGSTDSATAQANLDKAQQRRATAEGGVAAASQQIALVQGPARRAQRAADRATGHTDRAKAKLEDARGAMIDRRNAALQRIGDIKHSHADDVRTWRGNRAGAVALAGLLALAAVVALAWGPLSRALARRRRAGLDGWTFARWVAVATFVLAAAIAAVLVMLDAVPASVVAMIAVVAPALLGSASALVLWSSSAAGDAGVSEANRRDGRARMARLASALSAVLAVVLAATVLTAGLAQAAPRAPAIDPLDQKLAKIAWEDAGGHPTARVRHLKQRYRAFLRISARRQHVADELSRPLLSARSDLTRWRRKAARAKHSVTHWTEQAKGAPNDTEPAPPSSPPAASTPPDTGGDTPPRGPSGADGTYNCADFDTQAQAQAWLDANGNVDGLDGDNDGVACQSLP